MKNPIRYCKISSFERLKKKLGSSLKDNLRARRWINVPIFSARSGFRISGYGLPKCP